MKSLKVSGMNSQKVMMPGSSEYQSIRGISSFEFSVKDFLNLNREYLESLLGLTEAIECTHIAFVDCISFDPELIGQSLLDHSNLDSLWGLCFFANDEERQEISWPQSFWLEGASELGVVGFNSLGCIDHIVKVEAVKRYLAVVTDISLLTYLRYIWMECFSSKLPLCFWIKRKQSILNIDTDFIKTNGLEDLTIQLFGLAHSLSGKHRFEIKNKNLYEAIKVLKASNIAIDLDNHFSFGSAIPFHGYVDLPLPDCTPLTFYSNGDDIVCNSLVWTDGYEKMSTTLWCWLLKNRAYCFCLDIGAYNGFYGLIAARMLPNKEVHVFEPLHANYARCILNKNSNELHNMQVHPIAISDREEFTHFNIFSNETFLTSGGSLIDGHKGATTKGFPVVVTSIEKMLPGLKEFDNGLVKIDVEGVELQALRGMLSLIENKKLDVLLEVTAGDDVEAIHSIFSSKGYFLYDIDEKNMTVSKKESLKPAKDHFTLNKIYVRETLPVGG